MSTGESQFHEFLLAEYEHIADAHFKTNEAVSSLFRQYFTIAALPLTAIIALASIEPARMRVLGNLQLSLYLAGVLFVIIALTGLMMLIHMSNLRFDSLLYARTINSIRKHYFDISSLSMPAQNMMRVLPQSGLVPRYLEGFEGLMPPFVATFVVINTIYLYIGLVSFALASDTSATLSSTFSFVNLMPAVFAATHVFAYVRLAQVREDKYLHSNVIGVDIDGVLNKQTSQFCRFLAKHANKAVHEAEIDMIPVHESATLGISESQELSVFNDPLYWTEMPVADGAADALRRMRNSLNLKVHIFTHRPWPTTIGHSSETARLINSEFVQRAWVFEEEVMRAKSFVSRIGYSIGNTVRSWEYRWRRLGAWIPCGDAIDVITTCWLDKHGIEYDALMIEKGSEQVADPASHIHNRYYASRTNAIRYFVEDDPIKAKRLAHICDIVFLFEQPYNRDDAQGLPKNVVPVSSWRDILVQMRQLV